ncbi:MAG TPA: ABC transporter permease [Clostridia bacterium]|nr:ABC transporter permease [Clostridia bacterium]
MSNKKFANCIHIVKRDVHNKWVLAGLYGGGILLAFILGAILLAVLKVNPFEYYKDMFTIGMIGNKYLEKSIENWIIVFIPLVITSLGLTLAFKMRFWNIGGKGQFIIGSIVASAIALTLNSNTSPFLLITLMSIGGGLSAGLYGMITAVLKVKFGTNETILTLMLNYIALYILFYFGETQGTWNIFLAKDSVRPVFEKFSQNAWMTTIEMGDFKLNVSIIIAFLFAIFVWFYLNKTKQGYEISVVGDSISTAKYAGMKVNKIIVRTMFISAMLIGIAGAFNVSTAHTLSSSVSYGEQGWTGIVVVWLAKLNPFAVVVISILLSWLQYGCIVAASSYTTVNSYFADMLQGIILFIVLAVDFFIRYKIVFNKKRNSPKTLESICVKEEK